MEKGAITFITHNLGTKIVAVFVAGLLWFVVQGSEKADITKEIPLNIILPEGLVLSEVPESHIKVFINGPKAFLETVANRVEEAITIDLSKEKEGRVLHRVYAHRIKVPFSVKVLRLQPSEISLNLEALATKVVKLNVVTHGKPADGYKVEKVFLEPTSTVEIQGPRSRVSKMKELKTQIIDVEGLSAKFSRDVELDLVPTVTLNGPLPHAVVEFRAVTPNFRVANVEIRVLSQHKFRLQRESVVVYVRANRDQLDRLDQSRIYAEVDLKGAGKGVHTAEVFVRLPDEIDLVKVVPDKINLTLY